MTDVRSSRVCVGRRHDDTVAAPVAGCATAAAGLSMSAAAAEVSAATGLRV